MRKIMDQGKGNIVNLIIFLEKFSKKLKALNDT